MKRTLLACLLLTACTSGASTGAAPTSAPPATPSSPAASPAGADPSDLLVAVTRADGSLELHRVDRATRVAVRERVLEAPQPGARVLDASVATDQVCAAWGIGTQDPQPGATTSVVCYPFGSSQGRVVEGVPQPAVIALSADGSRLAWAQLDEGGNQAITTAALEDGTARVDRRFLARADRPETGQEAFTGFGVQDLAWVDSSTVAVSSLAESDDGPELLLLDVASPRTRGWLDDGKPVAVAAKGYLVYDSVVSVEGRTALAVHRGSYLDEQGPPSQAVRLDLRTGRIREVIATAADRRDVVGVSGSTAATLYVTKERFDQGLAQAYLRLAGESRGVPITGLPTDLTAALTRG